MQELIINIENINYLEVDVDLLSQEEVQLLIDASPIFEIDIIDSIAGYEVLSNRLKQIEEIYVGQNDIDSAVNEAITAHLQNINHPTNIQIQEWNDAYLHSQEDHAPSDAVSLQTIKQDTDIAEAVDHSKLINENPHGVTKELISDLKKDQYPEFANIIIPALNTTSETGGEISTTVWTWIQSVYSSIVAKSVKSHIIGLWTSLRNQNRTIRDITITQDASSLTINTDSDGNSFEVKEGETLRIVAYFPSYAPAGVTNYLHLRLNGITTNIYASSNVLGSYFRQTLGDNQATFIAELEVINGFIHLNWFVQRNIMGVFASVNVNGFTTESLGSITSIYLLVAGSAQIRTGSRIKVKHIKSNS